MDGPEDRGDPLPADLPDYLAVLPDAVPAGRVLVHNRVLPVAAVLGDRGSRAWLADSVLPNYEPCSCDWAPDLGAHYWSPGPGGKP